MSNLAEIKDEEVQQKAWVVFSNQVDVPWLSVLKPGFRHCYLLLQHEGQWLSLDPMLNHMDLQLHKHVPADFNLPGWLESRGQLVMAAPLDRSRKKPAPWRPLTCVEAVKRVLGIHARFILTPWQLYRHLLKFQSAQFQLNQQRRLAWEV